MNFRDVPSSDPGVLLSVVVPSAGRNETLRRCLGRLAPGAQSLDAAQYEVIVADDGPAGTVAAMTATEFPWVRVVAGPRQGPAANRNAGAAMARGAWVAFTDDDCVPDRDWLAALARETGSGVDVLEGRTTCEAGIRSPLDHAPINESGRMLWSCNLCVRASRFAALGGFDARFPHPHMEDVDFRDRVRAAGLSERFVRDAVVDHPPRRLAFGARLGETHFGDLLYAAIHDRPITRSGLIWRTARLRMRVLARHGGRDAIAAIGSCIAECVHIWRRWTDWQAAARAAAARGPGGEPGARPAP